MTEYYRSISGGITNKEFLNICKQGTPELIAEAIVEGPDHLDGDWDWNEALEWVCMHGHLDLTKLMIQKGANSWKWGLLYACRFGHLDIAELMIKKGATNFNSALQGACRGGYLDIVNLMIEHGANDWTEGLKHALMGCHLEIIKLMIEKGANIQECINDSYTIAHTKKELIDYFRQR